MHTQALALANDHVVMTIAPVITFKKTDGPTVARCFIRSWMRATANTANQARGAGRRARRLLTRNRMTNVRRIYISSKKQNHTARKTGSCTRLVTSVWLGCVTSLVRYEARTTVRLGGRRYALALPDRLKRRPVTSMDCHDPCGHESRVHERNYEPERP